MSIFILNAKNNNIILGYLFVIVFFIEKISIC